MKLWLALSVLAILWATIHFVFASALEENWRAGSNASKFAKAGVLAALKTVDDFLKIALIVFSATFIILSLLSLTAPVFGAEVLKASYSTALFIKNIFEPLGVWIGRVTLGVALLALLWFAWRMSKGRITAALEEERGRQLEILLASSSRLEQLPPTPQMQQLAREIIASDGAIAELRTRSGKTARETVEQLERMRDSMRLLYEHLDLDRRIDLSQVPIDDPVDPSAGILAKLRLGLFSKGMQKSLAVSHKWVKRVGTAVACVLVIGVSAPVLAKEGLVPTLGSINDLQVLQTQKAAQDLLTRVAQEAVTTEAEASEPSAAEAFAYRLAAQQFAQALVASDDWTAAVVHAAPETLPVTRVAKDADRLIEELAIRDTLLREYSDDAAERGTPLRSAGLAESADIPEPARRQYGLYRALVAGDGAGPQGGATVGLLEKWLRAMAEISPKFHAAIMAGAASFQQSASFGAMANVLLNTGLSNVIEKALPDPKGADLFTKKAFGATRTGLQGPVERQAQIGLATFYRAMISDQGMEAALRAVQKGPGPQAVLMRREVAEVRNALAVNSSQASLIVETVAERHPSLQRIPSAAEEKRVAKALRALGAATDGSSDLRKLAEGNLGSYDDLFPGRVQAVVESALGKAFAELGAPFDASALFWRGANGTTGPPGPDATTGGGGGGGGAPSRSFSRLRGSIRVGGVLIGAQPGRGAALDMRDIGWSIDGTEMTLWLQGPDGRRVPVGSYSGEMVQQALAYAADERPVAVTMTSGPLMVVQTPQASIAMLRVHLHPALVDTKLGCQLMELDRFVDTATGSRDAKGEANPRGRQEEIVATQLQLYNLAADYFQPPAGRLPALERKLSQAFPTGEQGGDGAGSIFAHHQQRFNGTLANRLNPCRHKAASSAQAYFECVRSMGHSPDSYPAQEFQIWSGVREREYPLSLTQITAPVRGAGSDKEDPRLRFMLQVAFEQEQERPCPDTECARATRAVAPWEFPVIAGWIETQTQAFAQSSRERRAILESAESFTTLQRLFRVALSGDLGQHFPRAKLVSLMREAGRVDPVARVPTPDWNQSDLFARQMLRAMRTAPAGTAENAEVERLRVDYLSSALAGKDGDRFSGGQTCAARQTAAL